MIEISEFRISGYGLLQALAVGVLLFAVLKLLRRGLRLLPAPMAYRRLVPRIFPAAAACSWFAFAYWALQVVVESPSFRNLAWLLVLVIALGWLAWFALRDYFAGLVLKVHDDYQEGQRLKVGDIEGSILRLGPLDMEIEQSNGERVKIPFGRIAGEIHWKNKAHEGPNYHKFVIHMARSMSVDLILDRLRLSVLNSPWAAPNREPQIRLIGQTDREVNCEVCVYALHTDYFHLLERDVKQQISG